MPKKSAAYPKKVNEAVQIPNTTAGLNVPQTMILARFASKDTTDKVVRRTIRCRLEAQKAKQNTPRQDAPLGYIRIATNGSVLLPLTGNKDHDHGDSGNNAPQSEAGADSANPVCHPAKAR